MDEEEECDCPPVGAPEWMATFSDMATLMLCFFILLLSFANMDVQNFRTALGSVREAFGVQHEVQGRFESLSDSPISLSNEQSTDVLHNQRVIDREALGIVREFLAAKGLSKEVEVVSTSRGLVIRTKNQVLFASGAAELKKTGYPVLDAIIALTEDFDGQVAIEGHTDDRPMQSHLFPSNWELSSARASAVLRYLVSTDVDPGLLHVAGYADMRPIARNDTPEGRSTNRRVEFVFEYDSNAYSNPADAFRLPKFKKLARAKAKEAAKHRDRAAQLERELEAARTRATEATKDADKAAKKVRRIRRNR